MPVRHGSVTPAVLVVDDELLLRIDTAYVVESAGFEVLEAPNADEGLELILSRPDIRVLITDIEMPGTMDGLAFARTVHERWPSMHVIVVSGRRMPDACDLPENGIFFSKPLSSEQLLLALNGLIG